MQALNLHTVWNKLRQQTIKNMGDIYFTMTMELKKMFRDMTAVD